MIGYQTLCIFVLSMATLQEVTPASREERTGALHIPEKIIGGVIDIVQSHKNKPVQGTQQTYPNYQYPQYQQWNGQSNYQSQGMQAQTQFPGNNPGQYQNQGQYNYQNSFNQGGNYPQGSNFNNQAQPTGTGQSFNQGSTQGNGQYQAGYQNANQFQTNQMQNQQGFYNGMTQSNGQNQYQGSQFQVQTGQNQGSSGTGQVGQGFLVSGNQQGSGNGQGPTCVCQAWTKPQPEVYADPVTEKVEKKEVSIVLFPKVHFA